MKPYPGPNLGPAHHQAVVLGDLLDQAVSEASAVNISQPRHPLLLNGRRDYNDKVSHRTQPFRCANGIAYNRLHPHGWWRQSSRQKCLVQLSAHVGAGADALEGLDHPSTAAVIKRRNWIGARKAPVWLVKDNDATGPQLLGKSADHVAGISLE